MCLVVILFLVVVVDEVTTRKAREMLTGQFFVSKLFDQANRNGDERADITVVSSAVVEAYYWWWYILSSYAGGKTCKRSPTHRYKPCVPVPDEPLHREERQRI